MTEFDTTSAPSNAAERLEWANRLYRTYHTRCFWHCPRDLVITEDLLPMVIKGLRTHGGRRGFILSGMLRTRDNPRLSIAETNVHGDRSIQHDPGRTRQQ